MSANKLALITGAAGDIGLEVASRLDKEGYRLILVDINRERLEGIARGFNNAVALTVDLTNRSDLDTLNTQITSEFGPIDVAFVNAGVVCVGDVLDLSTEQVDLQLDLNLVGTIHLIKACAQNMAASGSGHIVSTVSIGGIVALKGSAVYSATKFGLRGFLTALRDELKPKGISVSGIYPSAVDTQMLRYEAESGGSPLNFISDPVTVEDVGDSVMQSLKSKKLEYYVPYSESISARIIGFFPWLSSPLYPVLESIGRRGLKKYLNTLNNR